MGEDIIGEEVKMTIGSEIWEDFIAASIKNL